MLASFERIPSMWESLSGSDARVSVPPPAPAPVTASPCPRPPLTVDSPPRERESLSPVLADLRNDVDVLCHPLLLASGTGDGGVGRSETQGATFNTAVATHRTTKETTSPFRMDRW